MAQVPDRMQLRFPDPETFARVKRLAQIEHRTINGQVVRLVELSLEEAERQAGVQHEPK